MTDAPQDHGFGPDNSTRAGPGSGGPGGENATMMQGQDFGNSTPSGNWTAPDPGQGNGTQSGPVQIKAEVTEKPTTDSIIASFLNWIRTHY
jgi:hypothetical protein